MGILALSLRALFRKYFVPILCLQGNVYTVCDNCPV